MVRPPIVVKEPSSVRFHLGILRTPEEIRVLGLLFVTCRALALWSCVPSS